MLVVIEIRHSAHVDDIILAGPMLLLFAHVFTTHLNPYVHFCQVHFVGDCRVQCGDWDGAVVKAYNLKSLPLFEDGYSKNADVFLHFLNDLSTVKMYSFSGIET